MLARRAVSVVVGTSISVTTCNRTMRYCSRYNT
jgi:hypothetical protein